MLSLSTRLSGNNFFNVSGIIGSVSPDIILILCILSNESRDSPADADTVEVAKPKVIKKATIGKNERLKRNMGFTNGVSVKFVSDCGLKIQCANILPKI
ncbi:hypothetical protein MASR2M12_25960 [Bacteroidales bacterium]